MAVAPDTGVTSLDPVWGGQAPAPGLAPAPQAQAPDTETEVSHQAGPSPPPHPTQKERILGTRVGSCESSTNTGGGNSSSMSDCPPQPTRLAHPLAAGTPFPEHSTEPAPPTASSLRPLALPAPGDSPHPWPSVILL